MLENIFEIASSELINEANKMKLQGYRLVSVSCEQIDSKLELTYHFDKNYEMKHLRLNVGLSEKLTSISTIYPSAFLIENEYQDLYGMEFTDLTIDYKGNLYLSKSAPKAPLIKQTSDLKGE